jgi:hypothetical protein
MQHASHSPTRIEAAESVIALLTRLNASRFPSEEQVAVAVCQMRALREWIEAIRAAKAHSRFQRLFKREAFADLHRTDPAQTSLSCFLVDRGHPQRQ